MLLSYFCKLGCKSVTLFAFWNPSPSIWKAVRLLKLEYSQLWQGALCPHGRAGSQSLQHSLFLLLTGGNGSRELCVRALCLCWFMLMPLKVSTGIVVWCCCFKVAGGHASLPTPAPRHVLPAQQCLERADRTRFGISTITAAGTVSSSLFSPSSTWYFIWPRGQTVAY